MLLWILLGLVTIYLFIAIVVVFLARVADSSLIHLNEWDAWKQALLLGIGWLPALCCVCWWTIQDWWDENYD